MHRKLMATLVGFVGLPLWAVAALATVPDPKWSTYDAIGVGSSTGTAYGGAPAGWDVSLKDINNQPFDAVVTLRFAGTGVRAYASQGPGTTVDALAQTVSRLTVNGQAKFAIRTGGFCNANQVEIIEGTTSLGFIRWRSTDIDALDGRTGLTDLTYVADRYLHSTVAPECNLDLTLSDAIALADLSIEANEYLSSASGTYAW